MNLKNQFEQLCSPFTEDHYLIDKFWKEIETKYTEKGRHYHNLLHLENMFHELETVKDKILNFATISFSVFYHDIIYDATSKSNEEKSAEISKARLTELGLDKDQTDHIFSQIIATKAHQLSEDADTNYLLDADLSILGKDYETYLEYTKMIRKEYSIYPNILYKPGRKKVLTHFLELENIFKTEYFKDNYDVQARKNIEAELRIL